MLLVPSCLANLSTPSSRSRSVRPLLITDFVIFATSLWLSFALHDHFVRFNSLYAHP